MKTHLYATIAAIVAILFVAPAAALAENKVIAKIDGVEITEQDFRFAELEIGSELNTIPPEQQKLVLLEFLIENQLLAKAAEKEKLDSEADFEGRLKYYRKRALRDVYFDKFIRKMVKEEDAKKIYDDVKSQKEFRASHILVKTEQEAKDIVAELKKGADFAKLASEKSTGPSKTKGGDLGFFAKGRMVPEFEKVAFALKKDEVSEPVKTQFGWHVIKLTDTRDPQVPEFDAVKSRLIQSLLQQKAQKAVKDLRGAAKIEILDEKLDKELKAVRGSFSGEESGDKEKK